MWPFTRESVEERDEKGMARTPEGEVGYKPTANDIYNELADAAEGNGRGCLESSATVLAVLITGGAALIGMIGYGVSLLA
mgnify:CR=1 FL=1